MVKVENIKSKETIEVPFAHAIGVLLPQGNYKLVEEVIRDAVNNPVEIETGKATFDEEALKVTRAEMCAILDGADVKYPANANKANLLDLIKKNKLIGVQV